MPEPTTPRPDVPDELIKLAEDADSTGRRDHCRRYGSWKSVHPDQLARVIAAVVPEIERSALRRAAEQLLASGSHDDRCSYGPPGTCDCALGEHYRWLIKRSEETP